MSRPLVVRAFWDHDAEVWVASSLELRGLHTEAPSLELLRGKLPGMIRDLFEENHDSDLPVSMELIADPHNTLAAG